MIKISEKLTILYDDNTSFSDVSKKLTDFNRDSETITYISAEDDLYIGFYKPINALYAELVTANTNDVAIDVQHYNGSSFVTASGQFDDTDGLQRSGFIRWDREQTSEAKATVNSSEKYWYKLVLDGDSSAMEIRAINIVFSDDEDLKRELYEVSRYLPSGATSHILSHVSARDEIIQDLNVRGRNVKDATSKDIRDMTAWDLLEVDEVRLASCYLALSKIMFSVSDDADDVYQQKSDKYRSMAMSLINGIDLSVDFDDDGLEDDNEREKINYGFITRL